jgi:hypothetical protein
MLQTIVVALQKVTDEFKSVSLNRKMQSNPEALEGNPLPDIKRKPEPLNVDTRGLISWICGKY